MRKTLLPLLIILVYSCSLWEQEDPSNPLPNQAPETYLSLIATDTIYAGVSQIDTLIDSETGDTYYDTLWNYNLSGTPDTSMVWDTLSQAFTSITTSRQEIHWWGEDPDGDVVGYFYKWSIDTAWTYTTKEAGLFYVPIRTDLDVFGFEVKAVDATAQWDYNRPTKSDIDDEYFSDVGDQVDEYDENDIVLSEGLTPGIQTTIGAVLKALSGTNIYALAPTNVTDAIDLSPAKMVLPIRNSEPQIAFRYRSNPLLSNMPGDTAFTFPTRTFVWDITDLDGVESVVSVFYALDDTCDTCWYELDPAKYSSITLTDTSEPRLEPGFHTFYVKAQDIAGAMSNTIFFPDTANPDEPNFWKVKPVVGSVLLVDDYPLDSQNNEQQWYKSILDTTLGSDQYSTWEIGSTLPYSSIDVSANLKYFSSVVWYSAYNGPETYLDAGSSISSFVLGGGNFFINAPELKDSTFAWFPLTSYKVLNPTGRMFAGQQIISDVDSTLDLEVSHLIAIRVRSFVPDSSGFAILRSMYHMPEPEGSDAWTGTPTVASLGQFQVSQNTLSGKVVLFSIPFHSGNDTMLDGNGSGSKFISYVLREEFNE